MLKAPSATKLLVSLYRSTILSSSRLLANSAGAGSDNSSSFLSYDKDPGPTFIREDVQKLLHSMTRLELDKVFRKRSVKKNTVEYKFMTDAQLREELLHSIREAKKLLQMPPVVGVQQDKLRVLSTDAALKSLATSKFVFTDVTYGIKNSQRTIIERHPDGTLQEAAYETRKRLNQIYFPLKGRHVRQPKMFDEANLKPILEAGEYEFVLDRACVQFEPFERDYHKITALVYQHVDANKAFDALRYTRHFGPLVFFLAWHRLVDDLLLDQIKHDYLRNGVELIMLFATLHDTPLEGPLFEELRGAMYNTDALPIDQSGQKTTGELREDERYLTLIEQFVNEHGIKKVQLNLAIQAYRELAAERLELAEGIQRAHGES